MKRRTIWTALVAMIVVAAALPLAYLSLDQASPCTTPSGEQFHFTPTTLRSSGTIVMTVRNPTLASIAPWTQSNTTVAIAVMLSNPGSVLPNASLRTVAGTLRTAGIVALGYVSPGSSALEEIRGYAAAGLAGIYLTPDGSGGPCTSAQIISFGHAQDGFVAQGVSEPAIPGPSPLGVNLTIVSATQTQWTPTIVLGLAPYASETGVVVLNASPYLTLCTVGSFHSIGVRYFQVANWTNGTELLPESNEPGAYQQVYQSRSILPFDWLYHAFYPRGSFTAARASSGNTFYALTETDVVPGGGDGAILVNQTMLALNLTYGDPIAPAWTYSYTIPTVALISENRAVSVQNGSVCAVDAYLHIANQSGLAGWNLSVVASVANASTLAPLIHTEHNVVITFPPSTETSPFAFTVVRGEFVTVVAPLTYYSSGYVQLWVSVCDGLRGDEVYSEVVRVVAVGSNLVGWSMQGGSLGPYTYAFGTVSLINGSSVPFTVLLNQTGQLEFEYNGTPALLFTGNALYFLADRNGSTDVMAYFLGSRTLDSLANLGPISNLTGAVLPADGLYLVEQVNGTYLAFNSQGAEVWEIQVPLNQIVAYPNVPTVLPDGQILIGTILNEYTVFVTQYSQEFLLVNATSGQSLEWFNYSFAITPVGSPPGLPPNLPPEYGSISLVGGMIEVWAWYQDFDYFSPISVLIGGG